MLFTKTCTKCKKEKPMDAFGMGKRLRPKSRCNACLREDMADYRAKLKASGLTAKKTPFVGQGHYQRKGYHYKTHLTTN